MKHPNAVTLAKRLLNSRIKRQPLCGLEAESQHRITEDEVAWALDILTTYLDACLKQNIRPDFCDAVEEALEFALRHEVAYEPIPTVSRWHSALVMLEERDAD